jgi:hypothetical protein
MNIRLRDTSFRDRERGPLHRHRLATMQGQWAMHVVVGPLVGDADGRPNLRTTRRPAVGGRRDVTVVGVNQLAVLGANGVTHEHQVGEARYLRDEHEPPEPRHEVATHKPWARASFSKASHSRPPS